MNVMNEKQFYLIWFLLVGMFCVAAVMVLLGPYIGYELIFGFVAALMLLWMVYGLGSNKIRRIEQCDEE